MGLFKTIRSSIINLQQIGQDYLETQVELLKVQAAEKISSLLANMIAALILSLFLLFFLLFASIGLAHVLSDWIGRSYAGFLIMAGFYLLIGYVVFKNRERILRRPILNAIVRQLFSQKKSKETDK